MDEQLTPPEQTKANIASGKTQVGGLDYNTAALLCYLPICAINLIASIIFWRTEPKENQFVRFHAMQSLIMCLGMIVGGIAVGILQIMLGFIPLIGGMVAGVLSLAWLVVVGLFIWKSITGMIAAHKGEMTKIEYVGNIAEQKLAEGL
jgi:uncharacterized membrane protein